jgi:hypothetical protein
MIYIRRLDKAVRPLPVIARTLGTRKDWQMDV